MGEGDRVSEDALALDKLMVRRSFERAAASYDAAAVLQNEVCRRMLARLDYIRLEPETILDAGSGTGNAVTGLLARFPAARVIALDLALAMARRARSRRPRPALSTVEGWRRLFVGGGQQLVAVCGDIEQLLGTRRYLVYYLLCVVGAAVTQLLVMGNIDRPPVPTVGASGGVFGLLLAFGMAFPQRRIILLFPPIPMPAWLFVTLYGLLELYLGVTGTSQGVAHFAHLGGMVVGFVLLTLWRGQTRRR